MKVFGLWVACLAAWACPLAAQTTAQSPPAAPASVIPASTVQAFTGLPVRRIAFEGVADERLSTVRKKLPLVEGQPLDADKVAESLRMLFSTGLFADIEAGAVRENDGVAVIFRGTARRFVGMVTVDGAKGATLNTQLERASRLNPGTRLTEARLTQAEQLVRQVMADNGFRDATVQTSVTAAQAAEDQLANVSMHVTPGAQAHVGTVTVTGDAGMSLEDFRHYGKLRSGNKVDRETVSRALAGVLKQYRKQQRLEADVKLESQEYVAATHHVNYRFTAARGPVVTVSVDGAKLSKDHIEHLVPVFEEGTVDEDLLNEGGRRIRNWFQSQGYFDVKVDHSQQTPNAGPDTGKVLITYTVDLGAKRKVESVKVAGNHYFNAQTLTELLSVQAASKLNRQGVFSQALVTADTAALSDVYKNNGFSKVSVNAEIGPVADTSAAAAAPASATPAQHTAGNVSAPLTVVYRINEGPQQRVGAVTLVGNTHVDSGALTALLNTQAGQLFSPRGLAGDRDALMTEYLSRGFGEARVDVEETNDKDDPAKIDVVFHISEGEQMFVGKVLVTGLHYTRKSTAEKVITVKKGDPLNLQALQQTQGNLYDLALFNEVNTAVENPNGAETDKTILVQTVEARRWTLTYGGGLEAQTGTPQNNCKGYIGAGLTCTPNGKTGVSARGLGAITRNNLFGREQSASIQGTYGELEQQANLIYQNPHFLGSKTFGLTFSGGYANSQSVTTYVASKLDAGFRVTQTYNNPAHWFTRANTFVYEFDFRRVKVAESSLQVYPANISPLSTAVRVGGPGFTWIRDTRDSPVDAHKGTYTSFQEFISAAQFGAQAQFNRIDTSNSSYYSFDKGNFVLARNTRYGQERALGNAGGELLPLPERLYAGGAASLRGFSSNAAGPRDPDTGYPIGGAGAFVNSTELRLPPPTLPYFGNTVSFVIFHDMGNIFNNSRDVWPSMLRIHQPDRAACKVLTPVDDQLNPPAVPPPTGQQTSTGVQGACSFNYFSHTPGIGLRYHTPVGPLRFDFSYNLNPPIYPININYSESTPWLNQHVGEAGHFNFFFSLGQTF